MELYIYIMFFIFGVCLGSFYNVLGMRLPKGESIVKPKSHCPKCQHELTWYELIPIISFLIQKGKCRKCHTKLSLFYPIIELSTGILFLISYHSFAFRLELLTSLILVSLFMIVIVSDLTYLIIPDRFIFIPAILIFIIKIVQSGITIALLQLGYGIISFLIMYLVMILGNFLFKKESLGGADIKLMFLVGLVLDPIRSIMVIFIASITALPVSLILLLKNKEHVIPYGPFIIFGLLIIYFTKLDLLEILTNLLNFF